MPKYSNTFGNVKIKYLGKGKFDFDFKGQKLSEEDISNLETALLYRRSVMECAEYCCAFYHELNERRFANFVNEHKKTIDKCLEDEYGNVGDDFDRCEDLFDAIQSNDIEKAQTLLEEGVDVNQKKSEESGRAPIEEAIENSACSPEMISLLIKHGADIHLKNKEGMNLIQSACIYNQNPAVIKVLIASGLDVNEKDNDGMNAILTVCSCSLRVDVVKTLVENGADLTFLNRNGENCLQEASNHLKCLKDLGFDEFQGVEEIIAYLQMQMGKIENVG